MPPLSDPLAALRGKAAFTAEDALQARRMVYGDGAISRQDAERLIALNEGAHASAPEWKDLFVEALTDYLVFQQDPRGYVDEAGAAWLIGQISHDGKVRTDTELEAVLHILERADSAPPSLAAFALELVKASILRSRPGQPGPAVAKADADRLRRLLFAPGGDQNLAVTRAEAEALFDLNDAVRGAANDPAWTDLFVKALGAAIMAASTYEPLSREDALAQEAWMTAPPEGTASFLSKMAQGLPHALDHTENAQDMWAADYRHDQALTAAAEPVSADEVAWLASRIGRDGRFDDNEKALIRFLKAESPSIHPALKPLIDQAA